MRTSETAILKIVEKRLRDGQQEEAGVVEEEASKTESTASKSKDEEKAGIKVKQIRGFAENVFEICDFSDHDSNQWCVAQLGRCKTYNRRPTSRLPLLFFANPQVPKFDCEVFGLNADGTAAQFTGLALADHRSVQKRREAAVLRKSLE